MTTGLRSTIQSRASVLKTDSHNVDIVSHRNSYARTSRRSHAEYRTQGAKVREEAAPVQQEILLPPSVTSSHSANGAMLANDYPNTSLGFSNQNNSQNPSMLAQTQERYDTFDTFNVQDLISHNQTSPNEMTQQTQADWSEFPCSMDSRVGTANGPNLNDSYQPISMPPAPVSSPCSSLPDPSNDYWSSHSLSDPQRTTPRSHNNSARVTNPACKINTPRPLSRHVSRPQSRSDITNMPSFCSDQQNDVSSTLSRTSNMHPDPNERNNVSGNICDRSSGNLDTGCTELTNAHSHFHVSRGQCSHCRMCGTSGPINDHSTAHPSPKSVAPSLSRSSGTSSSDDIELLSNCYKALASSSQQSDRDTESDSSPVEDMRSRKSSRNGIADCSPGGDRNLQQASCCESHRQKGVEKVVIIYMQGGKVLKQSSNLRFST